MATSDSRPWPGQQVRALTSGDRGRSRPISRFGAINEPPATSIVGDGAKPSLLRRIPWRSAPSSACWPMPTWPRGLPRCAEGAAPARPVTPAPAPAPPVLKEASPDAALQLLALLQREGRLVDFLGEDIGRLRRRRDRRRGARRPRGLRQGAARALQLEPVRDEAEGSRVTLPAGFDAAAVRLTGNVVGQPPFTGSLQPPRLARHRGAAAQAGRAPRRARARAGRGRAVSAARNDARSSRRYSHRHRPRHHPLRAGVRRHRRQRRRDHRARRAAGPAADRARRGRGAPLLPSFLYLPQPTSSRPASLALPWPADSRARRRRVRAQPRRDDADPAGVERQELAVPPRRRPARRASCRTTRRPRCARVSPLEASTRYLEHLREAWDHAHPEAPLAEQDVMLTVPASFDAAARELTVEAAQAAGFGTLTLLEEPQAAFYPGSRPAATAGASRCRSAT